MASTQAQILDALLNFRLGYIADRWNFIDAVGTNTSAPGGIGNGVALSYSFPVSLPAYTTGVTGFQAFTAEQAAAAGLVFAHYANLTGLSFSETAQLGTGNIALIQHDFANEPGVAGYAYSPGLGYAFDGGGTIVQVQEVPSNTPGNFSSGDVFIRAGYATGDYAPGGAGYEVLLHEIGHAMGLKHSFEAPGLLEPGEDHKGNTVMSYTEAPHSLRVIVTGTSNSFSMEFVNVEPRTLMRFDILALQHAYGSNTAYRNGADVYSWQPGEKFLETLWDGGGADTIDASNQTLPNIIDLTPGALSSIALRSTNAELLADLPAFSHAAVLQNVSPGELYSGQDNLAIAFGALIEHALGGSAADLLRGNTLANQLSGGEGDDTLVGGAGNDTLAGGGGTDLADYSAAASAVTAELWRGLASNDGDGGQDVLSGIERLQGSAHADLLAGTGGNESLSGGAGNDGLYAAGGDDTLVGGTGRDTMDGGAGMDTVDYSAATSGVTAELWRSFALNDGQGNQDALWNIERLIGSPQADLLAGAGNAESLAGGAGNDGLYSAAGNDTLAGGAGNDTMDGGPGVDTADYSAATAGVTAELWRSFALNDGQGGQDALWNIEALIGSPQADLLAGAGNAESLSGGAGNDGLYAAGGNDTLAGGAGNDTMDGGPGIDLADYSGATGNVTAELWRSFASNDGQGGQDALWNIEGVRGSAQADLLAGTTGDNLLIGLGGADQLFAAGGSDTLSGGAGNDTLNGGAGADFFLFDTAPGAGNVDVIQDFVVADDTVQLAVSVFTALGAPGALGAGMLRAAAGATTAADGNDHLIYNSSNGALYYDPDGSGPAAPATHFATLGAGLALTVTDFVVV